MTRTSTGSAGDRTRPLVLGYFRAHILMTIHEMAQVRTALAAFASAEGFTLGTVFIEHADSAPAAFEAMVAAVRTGEVKAVVVPSLRHLGVLGAPSNVKRQFESRTSARFLAAQA